MSMLHLYFICNDCAKAAGKLRSASRMATFHTAPCDVCGETKAVTEPRDWGHFRGLELRILEDIHSKQTT